MKIKVLKIFLAIILLFPTITVVAEDVKDQEEFVATEVVLENSDKKLFKQPISKRKIAYKFLLAMGGVAISSLGLYLILTLYNNVREKNLHHNLQNKNDLSLESPNDLNSAIKIFLEKTSWK